jgi:hypothetical protein
VAGVTEGGIGMLGMTQGRTGAAGIFVGIVFVTGTLSATTKLFRIDHLLNPKNKYLVGRSGGNGNAHVSAKPKNGGGAEGR